MLYVFKYVYKNYLTEIKIFISCPTTDVSAVWLLARILTQKLTLLLSSPFLSKSKSKRSKVDCIGVVLFHVNVFVYNNNGWISNVFE